MDSHNVKVDELDVQTNLPLQVGPQVWDATLAKLESSWRSTLDATDVAALGTAADAVLFGSPELSQGLLSLSAAEVAAADVDTSVREKLVRIRDKHLLQGHGFYVLRGLPVATWGDAKAGAAFLVLSLILGSLRPQNGAGHVLGHVTDLGLSSADPSVRIYQTCERQTFHTDSCDIVALLCLRPAALGGGDSYLVSAGAVFNRMRTTSPHLLRLLLEPIATDRRGEVPAGCLPFFTIPVFTLHDGHLNVVYQRQYIDSAQRFAEAYRLTPDRVAALDELDASLNDETLQVRMRLDRGDIQLVHNHDLLHDRTAFRDVAAAPRHLLRAWIAPPHARPLPDVFAERFGSVTPGVRGGVQLAGVVHVAPWAAPKRRIG